MAQKDKRTKMGKEVQIKDNDGKVVGSAKSTFYKSNEPSYFKTYVKDLMKLLNVGESHYMVLFSLLTRMDYNNQVNIYPLMRHDIAEEAGFKTVASVNNCITHLIKTGVLMRLTTGSYLINPNYFAKGSWDDIEKIQSTVTYDKDGKLIKVEMTKKPSSDVPVNDNFETQKD